MIFNERFEFPEKKFFWCNQANGMRFQNFPSLNEQHEEEINKLANDPFTGDWAKILKEVENPDEIEALKAKNEENEIKERDPLESTEEEDENQVIKVNFKEIDRLQYHVRAIENDCHIIPNGSVKLNVKHEIQRNEAYLGLAQRENFELVNYSHFRNVQGQRDQIEDDENIFSTCFLDPVEQDTPRFVWSL